MREEGMAANSGGILSSSSNDRGERRSSGGYTRQASPSVRTLHDRLAHVRLHRTVNLNVDGVMRHFVHPDLLQLDILVNLSMANNELQHIPAQISSLHKLRKLILADNCFNEIPPTLR